MQSFSRKQCRGCSRDRAWVRVWPRVWGERAWCSGDRRGSHAWGVLEPGLEGRLVS